MNPLFSDLEPGWAPDPVPLPSSSSQEVASPRQDRLLCQLPQTLQPHRGQGLPSPFPGPRGEGVRRAERWSAGLMSAGLRLRARLQSQPCRTQPGASEGPVAGTGVCGKNTFSFWQRLPVHMRFHTGSGPVHAVCGVISVWAQVFFLPRLPAPPPGPPSCAGAGVRGRPSWREPERGGGKEGGRGNCRHS